MGVYPDRQAVSEPAVPYIRRGMVPRSCYKQCRLLVSSSTNDLDSHKGHFGILSATDDAGTSNAGTSDAAIDSLSAGADRNGVGVVEVAAVLGRTSAVGAVDAVLILRQGLDNVGNLILDSLLADGAGDSIHLDCNGVRNLIAVLTLSIQQNVSIANVPQGNRSDTISQESDADQFVQLCCNVRSNGGQTVCSDVIGHNIQNAGVLHSILQIVVQGKLRIYCIRDDGSVHSLSTGQHDYLLGDMDIFSEEAGSVYAEADTDLICLALSIDENKAELMDNIGFLRSICSSLTKKMQMLATFDAAPASLKERVLTYMQYRCGGNELRGLERAAFHLNGSSRQLQRILNQYEADGIVKKIGKGSYRLVASADSSE